jgi:outer membrane protein, heavy metal efflux system
MGDMRVLPAETIAAVLLLAAANVSVAGDGAIGEKSGPPAAVGSPADSLPVLLEQADRDNPSIRAARQAWEAAREVPSQASTLPDPEIQLEEVSVGSPRPFAGYAASSMADVGLGVSQEFPYPGKLRLHGEIAARDAKVAEQRYEAVRLSVLAGLKAGYFELAYLEKALGILRSDGALLTQVTEAADARYRSGMGSQQDLIQAQLEQTKLLWEITLRRLDADQQQAAVKQLLDRPQSSPDIEPTGIAETPLTRSYADLLAAAEAKNPEIGGARETVDRQSLQVELARTDFYPDFTVQYMVNRPDPSESAASYGVSFGVRVPIFARRKQRHELAQARAELDRSRSDYEAQSAQVASELRSEYVTVDRTADLLEIYRRGLDPQARAEFQAGLAEYESGKQDFQGLLNAFLDVLRLDEQYWQEMAVYETSVARLEQLTGLELRGEGTDP